MAEVLLMLAHALLPTAFGALGVVLLARKENVREARLLCMFTGVIGLTMLNVLFFALAGKWVDMALVSAHFKASPLLFESAPEFFVVVAVVIFVSAVVAVVLMHFLAVWMERTTPPTDPNRRTRRTIPCPALSFL